MMKRIVVIIIIMHPLINIMRIQQLSKITWILRTLGILRITFMTRNYGHFCDNNLRQMASIQSVG